MSMEISKLNNVNSGIERMPEIQILKPGLEKILDTLYANIEQNKYDCIIAEGDSARVLTLLIGKAIQKIQEKKSKGISKILFINPDYAPRTEEYSSKMENVIRSANISNVLVVTEEIHSGYGMSKLFAFLKASGIKNVDVVAGNAGSDFTKKEEEFKSVLTKKVTEFNKDYPQQAKFSGEEVSLIFDQYYSFELTGLGSELLHNSKLNVIDDFQTTAREKTIKHPFTGAILETIPSNQNYVNKIRKDIEMTTSELAEAYQNKQLLH